MTGTRRPVPGWPVPAAWATVWCTVPSCVWQIVAGLGVDTGFTGELGAVYLAWGLLVMALTVVFARGART